MNDFEKTEADDGNFHGSGERILLVDDDPTILEWLEAFLSIYGYTVVCAPDAADALALYERERGDFDLLFTDVTLPKTSGVELAEQISNLRPEMPILIGSGYMNEEAFSLMTDSKRYPFMSKPYMIEELLKTIKQLMST